MSDCKQSLAGKIALVTGSARGLGSGMARALAAEGAAIAIHYRHSQAEAARLVEELHKTGIDADLFQADVTREKEVLCLRDALLRRFGRLDILVNNVGDFLQKPWHAFTGAEWEGLLASNLNSIYYVCRAFWPTLVAQHYGRIINIGLANSDRIQAYHQVVPYAIAKTGVTILSKSMAVEGAAHNITVNVIAPGLMDNGTLDETARSNLAIRVPAGRPGKSDDLNAALIFLCSDAAAYINGAHIPVSGGWRL